MTAVPSAVPGSGCPLADLHLADLRRSGLSDETIAASGIYSADAEVAASQVGMACGPAMVIPYPGATLPNGAPLCRVRPDVPWRVGDGKPAKYLSPIKRLNPEGNRLYIPPGVNPDALADATVPLLITEGEKKALKSTQDCLPCLGLPGVWSWRKRDEDDASQPIADLYKINWKGRQVGIVFDSDAAFNENVRHAEKALRDELRRRGARPYIVRLPEPTYEEAKTYGPKLGLDDFLCVRGAVALADLILASAEALPLCSRSARAILAEADPDEPELVAGLWPEAGCGFFAGEPKTKKSFLALSLAYSVASGRAFLGHATRKGCVVLVDEENDRRELKKRMRRVAAGLGVDPASDAIIVVAPSLLKLDNPEAMKELSSLFDEVKPVLVVFDPLVRLHQGEENETSTIAPMLAAVRRVSRHTRCAVVIVHHLRKRGDGATASHGQRMRGSSDLHGWLDAAVYFEKVDENTVKLTFETRYRVAPDPIHVQLVDSPDSTRWQIVDEPARENDADPVTRLREALADAAAPITREALKAATGLGDKRLRDGLAALTSAEELAFGSLPTAGKAATTYWLRSREGGTPSSSPVAPLGGGATTKKGGGGDAPSDPTGDLLSRQPPPKGDRDDKEGGRGPAGDASAEIGGGA